MLVWGDQGGKSMRVVCVGKFYNNSNIHNFTNAIFILQALKWHTKLYDRNSSGSTVWPHEMIANYGL